MLTEVCQYLKNWFNRKPDGTEYPKYSGEFTISEGEIQELSGQLKEGQYFRIMGSLFNDGVHKYGDSEDVLQDESFDGSVWSMGVPIEIVGLSAEIDAWKAKYESVDSEAMSPFISESFGGYSYSKSAGGIVSAGGGGVSGGWQVAYSARLAPWRKI